MRACLTPLGCCAKKRQGDLDGVVVNDGDEDDEEEGEPEAGEEEEAELSNNPELMYQHLQTALVNVFRLIQVQPESLY